MNQTNYVQAFMINQIQYNPISNKWQAIIHNDTNVQNLVQVNVETLEIKRFLLPLTNLASPMPGSYFDTHIQLFTCHVHNALQDRTELLKLTLCDNASAIVVGSKKFDFDVYGFGYIRSVGLLALWQFSIATPLVCIQIDEISGRQIKKTSRLRHRMYE